MVVIGQELTDSAPPPQTAGGEGSALRIACLDDDVEQAERICNLLQHAGHKVHMFHRGRSLLSHLRYETFDLIVLDWEVPDVSGYDVLLAIRQQLRLPTSVLFLTHRDGESDVVQALQAGADDFLIKPARERELLARVTAMGRRSRGPVSSQSTLHHPPFSVDIQRREFSRDGMPLELTRREFEVALLLFRHVGQVLSRGFIMDAVWGRGDTTTTRTVDMHVSRVRKVLGLSAAIGLRLTAVYGYGYRLEQTGTDPA
jgi:two-component system, OmpR family, response regulator RegX3